MVKNIEAINNKLDDIKSYRSEVVARSKAEIRATEAKIEDLEATLKESADIDEYKEREQELKDARTFLGFLKSRQQSISNQGLTDNEYRSMCSDIREEVEMLQEKYAPAIQKKLYEVVELMDEYAAEAGELEKVLNKAYMLHEGYNNYINGAFVRVACDIAKCNNDKNNIWGRFASLYFTHYVNRNK